MTNEQSIYSQQTSLALFIYFNLFLVCFVVAFTAAALGDWIDPSVILMPGEPIGPAVQETLLQRHPHKMGAIYQNLVIGHAVTAHLLFGLCIIYLWASMKAKPLHTYRKLFVLLWVLHIANGGIPAMHRLITHGLIDTNYLVGFSLGQYLLFFIVVCMMCVYLAQVSFLDWRRNNFSKLDLTMMKAASYFAFIIYAVSFFLGFYIQFLAGDFFEITRSLGYGFILMIFSGQVFISTHNLKFAHAVEMGAAPEDAYFLERSRNLMVAIFLTEMTFILNVNYRVGITELNGLAWIVIGLFCCRYAGRKFMPSYGLGPSELQRGG